MKGKWRQVEELFNAALELEPAARRSFLAEACADDEELRREVESLLAYENETAGFIRKPALEVVARELADEPALSIRTIDHFQILSLLGRGGMGEVYLAQDIRLGRKVALKLLPAEFTADADRLRRFVKEAKAASALNHPNILTVHEIGQVDGAHYIVTEFIDGQTLRQRMQTAKLSLSEVVDVAIQVTQALEAAHTAGIVHRDIKPENLMVRQDGLVKVLDFGLAKLTAGLDGEARQAAAVDEADTHAANKAGATAAGALLGTIRYMSPEQARGERVDARTDVFSLGVVLYEMLTGRTPFHRATATETLAAILEAEPAAFSEPIPEALQRLVTSALRKDCEERLQTAEEFASSLRELAEEMQFSTRLASTRSGTVVQKAAERDQAQRRRAIVALAVLVFCVAAGVALWLWLADTGGSHESSPAAARRLYASGRDFWNLRTIEGFRQGLTCFEQAVALDPRYAPAWTGIADSWSLLTEYGFVPAHEGYPKAKAAA